MNTLSSLPPPLLSPASLPGVGALAPSNRPADQAPSWLDDATQGASQPLHVGPNSRPRALEDIERDFVQALCAADPERPG